MTAAIGSRTIRRYVKVRNPRHRPVTVAGTAVVATGTENTVTGVATNFLATVQPGDFIRRSADTAEHFFTEVLEVVSNTVLTLKNDYAGTLDGGSTAFVVRRPKGRQQSPKKQGVHVNAGDAGFGQQKILTPDHAAAIPVNQHNVVALRESINNGDLELYSQNGPWFRAGTTHRLFVQNLSAATLVVGDELTGAVSGGTCDITAIGAQVVGATAVFFIDVDTVAVAPLEIGEELSVTAAPNETMDLVDVELCQTLVATESGPSVEIVGVLSPADLAIRPTAVGGVPGEGRTLTGVVAAAAASGITINYKAYIPASKTPATPTAEVQHLFSIDGGVRWSLCTRLAAEGDDANATGALQAITPTVDGLSRSFVWDAGTDLTLPATNVQYKIILAYNHAASAFSGGSPDLVKGLRVTA